jgi:uncharacterized membrane protein
LGEFASSFLLSLVPFATMWMGVTNFDSVTVAIYGGLLVFCGIAFTILARTIIHLEQKTADLSNIFRNTDRKGKLSSALYLSSIPLAFVYPIISCAIFAIVGIMWIIPSKDVEKLLE